MNKLQELIQELCPNGVEYRRLGEFGAFENIGVDKKTIEGQSLVTLLNYVDVYKNTYIDNSIPQMVVSASAKKIYDCSCEKGDIFITPTSETRDDIGHASVITETLVNTVYSYHIMRFRLFETNMTTSFFVRYLFETEIVQKQIYKLAKGLTRFGLSKYDFAKIEIPFPPLAVQEEIVKILDRFAEYAAELQAELQARQEQYVFYRDKLLSFNNINGGGYASVTWMKMSEIFDMRNGYTPSKANAEFWENGTIPWFRMEDIRTNGRILLDSIQHITFKAVKGGKLFQANSFIIATTATIGEHALLIADSLANQQFTNLQVRKSLKDTVLIKYLYYYMFIVGEWCKNNTNVSGFASVDMKRFKELSIPIPPIAEQEHIVSILDKFEALVSDLTEGLPAEISAVQERYEYYRNKLLSFPKNKISA